jgi:hypothetical protein
MKYTNEDMPECCIGFSEGTLVMTHDGKGLFCSDNVTLEEVSIKVNIRDRYKRTKVTIEMEKWEEIEE